MENQAYTPGDEEMGNAQGGMAGFLAVDNYEANAHTYVYDANRSLKGMTMEALPSVSNYQQDLANLGKLQRPTIEELKAGSAVAKAIEETEDTEAIQKKGKVVKFGWLEGVLMRCLLNIWGVMLFLRLTWVVGQCGIIQGIAVITLCNVVTFITAISMSAVATNGQIKGGGIYYMISRSLGPEFGGAIGIMFTISNSIAVATYLIGFCDSLLDLLGQYVEGFNGIAGTLDDRANDIRWIGTAVLCVLLGIAVVGMDWVTRVQMGLLVILILSQIDFIIGTFLPYKDFKCVNETLSLEECTNFTETKGFLEGEGKFGFTGYKGEVLGDNILTSHFHGTPPDQDYEKGAPSFFSVFGVFFPAVTGIVAGANLSGDLKDPATAIPKGTLIAIGLTYVTYVGYGFMIGSCYLPEASGDPEEYFWSVYNTPENRTNLLFNGKEWNQDILNYTDCSPEVRNQSDPCMYGSANDQQTLSKISYSGILVYLGCFAATLSSAIASLVGAPRVLQALARDKLYPLIGFFGKGHGANDDPFRGYFLCFVIAFGCTIIANLDIVSSLLSNFFVAAYALINFSVFHATITKSPGWRPSFKYYNHWVALFGTFLCVAVMFLMDWITALITWACVLVLYFYISYRKPEANWGSSVQAQQFVTALKNVQSLNEVDEHVKNYRPKVLVLTGIPAHRSALVDFANLLTKKLSLMICGHVAKDVPNRVIDGLKSNVNLWLRDHEIKAFYSVTSSNSFDEGAKSLLNLSGLGKLSPNMVLLGFKGNWKDDIEGTDQYINVVNHGFDLRLSVGILRLENGCDYSHMVADEETIMIAQTNEGNAEGKANELSVPEKATKKSQKKRKVSTVVYHGNDGQPLPKPIVDQITQFQVKKRKGFIDVWWLYDDGGLTMLLPYVLTTRQQFADCQLRIFALANRKDELDRETRNMAALLAKFRIDYADVTVIPDVTKKAKDETKQEFKGMLSNAKAIVSEEELQSQKEKTNRHLRLAELLREHSKQAQMIMMTLPVPRRDTVSSALYMAWLDIMTKNMPPTLLIRGNQTSVLTFYS